jgi:hypothetical protein
MEANYIKFNQLPQVGEVLPGNLLLIEDQTGTKTIDFKDFVIGPTNTSFYNAIVTNIRSVSTYSISLSSAIQKNTDQTLSKVDSRFLELTANFASTNPLWYIYVVEVTIPANERAGSRNFVAPLPNLTINDFNIKLTQPDTQSVIKSYFYQLKRNTTIDTNPDTYAYTLSISANINCTSAEQHKAKLVKDYYV